MLSTMKWDRERARQSQELKRSAKKNGEDLGATSEEERMKTLHSCFVLSSFSFSLARFCLWNSNLPEDPSTPPGRHQQHGLLVPRRAQWRDHPGDGRPRRKCVVIDAGLGAHRRPQAHLDGPRPFERAPEGARGAR